jgi:hypothetical protein
MTLSFGLRLAVYTRDNWRCVYCGLRMEPDDKRLHTDHSDPAGGDTLENLVTSCRDCNVKKGSRTRKAFEAGLPGPPPPYYPELMAIVEGEHKIKWTQIVGASKQPRYVRARRMFAVLARKRGASLPEIGRMLKRHHTTVMNLLK